MAESHDDSNHPNLGPFQELFGKAKRMTEAGANRITAGSPGEQPLRKLVVNNISLCQMPEDEHGVLRISLGEIPRIDESAYFVWRGDTLKVCNLLERALAAMKGIL